MTGDPQRSKVKATSAKQQQPAAEPAGARQRAYLLAELAERWNITDTHIAGLIDEGRLRAIDLAGKGATRKCLRVPVDEVQRFEIENSTAPAQQPGGKP
jgi:hypothetical protein